MANKYLIRSRTEEDEQCAVIEYLRLAYPNILLTIAPNGIKLTLRQGVRFKKMGYVAGTPDIMIFEPRGNYHGLFVEMKKAKGGTVSPKQKGYISRLEERGYKAAVCHGYYDAIEVLNGYLGST